MKKRGMEPFRRNRYFWFSAELMLSVFALYFLSFKAITPLIRWIIDCRESFCVSGNLWDVRLDFPLLNGDVLLMNGCLSVVLRMRPEMETHCDQVV